MTECHCFYVLFATHVSAFIFFFSFSLSTPTPTPLPYYCRFQFCHQYFRSVIFYVSFIAFCCCCCCCYCCCCCCCCLWFCHLLMHVAVVKRFELRRDGAFYKSSLLLLYLLYSPSQEKQNRVVQAYRGTEVQNDTTAHTYTKQTNNKLVQPYKRLQSHSQSHVKDGLPM